MSHDASLLLALVFAAIVAALHALGPRLRAVPGIEAASGTSLSGGLAAAYVFVYLLPELARGNQQVAKKLHDDLGDAAATHVGVFLVALLGFFVFFVLQWAAEQPRGDGREPSPAVFAAHVAGFSVYSALVVYLVPLRLQTSPALAAVFCGILALHLVSTDRLLRNRFPQRLAGHPHARLALSAGAIGGWALALLVPETTLTLTLLAAFLGGAVLLNVLDEELPARHEVRLAWFAVGLVVAAATLTALAAAGERGAA